MKKLNKVLISAAICLSLTGCFGPDKAIKQTQNFIEKQSVDKSIEGWKTQLTKPELLVFSQDKDYFWDLETTQGPLVIKLLPDDAPMHVSSTIYLTELGFYDGLTFHRVIPGFMAQGGDPIGNGTGNPGYRYDGEFDGEAKHDKKGMLSMANAGPGTDGSQFFITFKATPFLNGKHTVFGEVVQGLDDSLVKIEELGSYSGKTKEAIAIVKAAIRVEDKV